MSLRLRMGSSLYVVRVLSLTVLLLTRNAWTAFSLLTTLIDPTIRCDYLIVAPESMLGPAMQLANHRNSYLGDEVQRACVVTIEKVYEEFATHDSIQPFQALHAALLWARRNWIERYRMVVLIGDDSLRSGSIRSGVNRGPMPTCPVMQIRYRARYNTETRESEAQYDTVFLSSDLLYLYSQTTLGANSLWDSVASLGRIPCETSKQCSLYVARVIQADLNPLRGPWMNRMLFLVDDGFQGTSPDPLSHIGTKNRLLSFDDFRRYETNSVHLAAFSTNRTQQHTLAADSFFSAINQGAFWTIYFGHGHEQVIADEHVLGASDAFRLRNGEMRGVFCSFSCDNGAFHLPYQTSMCKRFLFAPSGGYLAYFASSAEQYYHSNERVAELLFKHRTSHHRASLGTSFTKALELNVSPNAALIHYFFLGDPAIRPFRRSDTLQMSISGNNLTCAALTLGAGSHYVYHAYSSRSTSYPGDPYGTYHIDTLEATGEGTLSSNSLSLPLPTISHEYRVVVYAWNDTAEARGTMTLNRGVPIASRKQPRRSYQSLSMTNGLFPGATSIVIRGINGRCVFRALSTRVTLSGLSSLGVPPGAYTVEARLADDPRTTKLWRIIVK